MKIVSNFVGLSVVISSKGMLMKRITIFENNLIKLDMYVALLTLVNMNCSLPTYTVGKIAMKKLFNHNRVIDTRLI